MEAANFPLIQVKEGVKGGQPCIKGKRITIQTILEEIATGSTVEEIMYQYDVTKEEVRACVGYAAMVVEDYWRKFLRKN